MVERRKGKVINIGSAAAKNPKPAISHYSASKAAVVAFTMSLAKEMAEHGVQVNAVCPGSVRTDIWKGLTPYYSRFWRVTEEEVVRRFLNAVLLGEVRSEDIAEMVIFLSSPKADRITGQAINVCGGEDIHY
jgi:meso-butanediol dehydrogenase/(S,S)-butanediol dehydrogenase/diacetyl reductase